MFSMETSWRVPLFTALAPIAWGSSYYVTAHFLPPDRPFFGAAVRALPVGLAMLAFTRRLPSGDWWWKAGLLGVLNIGAFFPLIFLAGYHLPGGMAATLTATAPIVVMLTAWALIAETPRAGVPGGSGDRSHRQWRCSCSAAGSASTWSAWPLPSAPSPCPAWGSSWRSAGSRRWTC